MKRFWPLLTGLAAVALVIVASAAYLSRAGDRPPAGTPGSPSVQRTIGPSRVPAHTVIAATPVGSIPTPGPGLTRFDMGLDWTFDYPATWTLDATVIEPYHYSTIGPVLGNGEWQIPLCVTPAPSVVAPPFAMACGTPSWNLEPGTVVVMFRYYGGPPGGDPAEPAGWTPMNDGILVTKQETDTGTTWQVYFPSHGERSPWIETVDVRYGPGDSTQARAQVQALIDSLRYPPRAAT